MQENPPVIKGETPGVIRRRRDALRTVLRGLVITPAGCMIHGDANATSNPQISWPTVSHVRAPELCQWPGVCGRPKAERVAKVGQHPVYCDLPEHNPSAAFEYRQKLSGSKTAELSRHYYHFSGSPVRQKAVGRLLLDLYFPGLPKPPRTMPGCGVRRCVNPQHRTTGLERWAPPRMSRDQFREIVLMVRRDRVNPKLVGEQMGCSESTVRNICCGHWRPEWTADIRAEFKPTPGYVHLDAEMVREIYMVGTENPGISATKLSAKFGVSYPTILKILRGSWHAHATADLRRDYPNDR